ncbi:hypothetical protein NPIL_526181 [Nephila pilipes]|uniref:Secreted protein n=1 Tax=Nephila pilipes TaxID=299642 RepID=A0A8X6PW10_NEPPI|nr:hypothetical protein NPIL_526181 [Nephila pilipes]
MTRALLASVSASLISTKLLMGQWITTAKVKRVSKQFSSQMEVTPTSCKCDCWSLWYYSRVVRYVLVVEQRTVITWFVLCSKHRVGHTSGLSVSLSPYRTSPQDNKEIETRIKRHLKMRAIHNNNERKKEASFFYSGPSSNVVPVTQFGGKNAFSQY